MRANRGGIVVIPEIFGVNSHIQQTTDGFAADATCGIARDVRPRAAQL